LWRRRDGQGAERAVVDGGCEAVDGKGFVVQEAHLTKVYGFQKDVGLI
jgi:hypothetical protein